ISRQSSGFARDVQDLLASVRIQGKPYFELVSMQQTASALRTQNRTFRDLNLPDIARSIGSSMGADGIFLGNIVRSGVIDTPYQESRSKCAQSQMQYNKKGQAIGSVCVQWSEYRVDCMKRNAGFEFVPNLIETATGRSIFSNRLVGTVSYQSCSDDMTRPQSDPSMPRVLKMLLSKDDTRSSDDQSDPSEAGLLAAARLQVL
ncbi:MAG: hypothetical protein ACRERS_08365, partial [Methylococcales bacterium]